jgi:hypothetical protein
MRALLLLVLIVLVVYLLYSNGTLSNLIPSLPDPNATPAISVTISAPIRLDGSATPAPVDTFASPAALAPTSAPVLGAPTASPLPAQPTLPPPTITVFEPPPTLAIETTPTPASDFPLVVETPLDGETLRASPWLVIGRTQPGALVSVNDVIGFANDEGRFALEIVLQEGVNVLEILASNAAGEQVFLILTVVYQP